MYDPQHTPQPGGVPGPRLRGKAKKRAASTSEQPKPGSRFKDKRFEKASPGRGNFKKANIRR